MPFNIQYDKDTGQILATVEGNFVPVLQDSRKQVVFDKTFDVYGKMVDLNAVEEGKVYKASKDQSILKEDSSITDAEVIGP